jgi:hypothetical protein
MILDLRPIIFFSSSFLARQIAFYADRCSASCRAIRFYNIAHETCPSPADVFSLSPKARASVAEKLIESLDSEPAVTLSSAWRDEVARFGVIT